MGAAQQKQGKGMRAQTSSTGDNAKDGNSVWLTWREEKVHENAYRMSLRSASAGW